MGKGTDSFPRRKSNLQKNQDAWETAEVLEHRNAALKHLAVDQCHPFHSSHFYENYFLQGIPHSPPSPADEGSRKDHSDKPYRTSGDQRRDRRTRTWVAVTYGKTVSFRRLPPEALVPVWHSASPPAPRLSSWPLSAGQETPAASPPRLARTLRQI